MTELALNLRDTRTLADHPPQRPVERLARALFATHAERTLRRELEARPDRLLADIGIGRDEIPAFARRAVRGA